MVDLPLAEVNEKELNLVVEFCQHHNWNKTDSGIKCPLPKKTLEGNITDEWDRNFVTRFDRDGQTDLLMAANAMGDHYRDTLGIPMHDLLYEDFRQAPNQFGKAIIESLGGTWVDVPAYHAACPVDLWCQYDVQLAPWTRETKTLAQSLGYPAK